VEADAASDLDKWCEQRHQLRKKVLDAATWARIWGGALLVIGADDRTDLALPLNRDRVRDIPWTLTVDRRYAIPSTFYSELSAELGTPETYRITVQTLRTSSTFAVHESRCIRFGATPTDPIMSRRFLGWDMPVLQRPYQTMRDFSSATQATANMLQDASQGVFKIKDLIAKLAGNQADAIRDRLTMMDLARSVARSILVDADAEDFTKVATSFAGVPETLDRFMQLMSAATYPRIPVSLLFGRSAAGMNATGDLDLDAWHAGVESYQRRILEPALLRAYDIMSLAKTAPTKGLPVKDLSVEWAPLHIPSDLEDAQAYAARASADVAYINAGVFDPAEVAIARAGGGEYSRGVPKIDVDKRQAELDAIGTFDDPNIDPDAPPQDVIKTEPEKLSGAEAPGQDNPPSDPANASTPPNNLAP
jgi:phage-related protein (TIGR01555 family)